MPLLALKHQNGAPSQGVLVASSCWGHLQLTASERTGSQSYSKEVTYADDLSEQEIGNCPRASREEHSPAEAWIAAP